MLHYNGHKFHGAGILKKFTCALVCSKYNIVTRLYLLVKYEKFSTKCSNGHIVLSIEFLSCTLEGLRSILKPTSQSFAQGGGD